MAKRLLDMTVAALGLLLLSPVLLAIAVCIVRDSRGPVLFRQQRVGRHGIPFQIHKFRTMRATVDAAALQVTAGGDPRITRVGRWLRRSKLDELPQLWDVLRGRMSLVGPRPEVPRYVQHYPPDLHQMVLSVRPGLTDAATLAYRDEETLLAAAPDPEACYVHTVLPVKLRLAADGVAQASFRGDLRILWRTLRAVLR